MYQELFDYMYKNHDVVLLESEMQAIVDIVMKSEDGQNYGLVEVQDREAYRVPMPVLQLIHNLSLERDRLRFISSN